ncbi:MAG: hypothetical protein GY721_00220 [Deltaproteobacteria bacterium]|nr:hypothetical protein [Deltaproteobacteria bacterium]
MTLAAGFKFEHPKAQGVSPILLLSDSRYSRGTQPYRDDGKKICILAKNIYAAFAGDVLTAQRALARVKEYLALSSSGTFEDLVKILKSSFDSEIIPGDPQTPHCILGAISTNGNSKLLYARPDKTCYEYEVSERSQAVIGLQNLEPKLWKKINEPKPKGLWRPEHFMFLPDVVFPSGYDRKQRAIQDAREISRNILWEFLEIVDDPRVDGANPPLQNVLLLPSRSEVIDCYELNVSSIKSPKITRKTARAREVYEEPDSGSRAIVELNVWDST